MTQIPISRLTPVNSGEEISDTAFVVSTGGETKRLSLGILAEQLKREIKSEYAIAVVRCKHCGQWGARFCECRKCGAPIE